MQFLEEVNLDSWDLIDKMSMILLRFAVSPDKVFTRKRNITLRLFIYNQT